MTSRLMSLLAVLLVITSLAPCAHAQQPCADLSVSIAGNLSSGGLATFSLQSAPPQAFAVIQAAVVTIDLTSGDQIVFPATLRDICFGIVDQSGNLSCSIPIPQVPAAAGIASVTLAAEATLIVVDSFVPPITVRICKSDRETATIPF